MEICVGASAGGHMNELLSLIECDTGVMLKPSIYITTDEILKRRLQGEGKKVFILGECNRCTKIKIFFTFFKAFSTFFYSKPDVVITTGALPMAIYSWMAKKLFAAKIIWIDSIANIDDISMSGRWVIKFADRIYTQWPHLVEKYPKLIYVGNLL